MAKQQQMTQEQLALLKEHQNSEFMRLSYLQPIKMNAENGRRFQQGTNLTFNSPIINGAYAQSIILKYKLNVNWEPGTTGTITPTASYPESFVTKAEVNFGNKQISAAPFLFSQVLDKMEGYGRTSQDDVLGSREAGIDAMLRKVPRTFVAGDNEVKFEVNIPLTLLHNAAINGMIPIFSSGVRLQLALQLPNNVVGKDVLQNVFDVQGDGVVEVSGDIDAVIEYRDYNSFSTTQAVRPDLTGLPTVQMIELPSITGITPGVYNHVAFRNPYNFAKLIHVVIDGKQSDKFASAGNISGFTYDKEENSNSAFFRYDETTTGIEGWYKKTRELYGNDLPEGIIAWDATSQNVGSNVSSKMGSSYLNLSGAAFVSARASFKVDSVSDVNMASRIVSYGIMINPNGIQVV